jgi:hypothetical protein
VVRNRKERCNKHRCLPRHLLGEPATPGGGTGDVALELLQPPLQDAFQGCALRLQVCVKLGTMIMEDARQKI